VFDLRRGAGHFNPPLAAAIVAIALRALKESVRERFLAPSLPTV